jgi:hypothetical protein
MPFGLELKSIIIGIIFALFVYPRLVALVTSRGKTATN